MKKIITLFLSLIALLPICAQTERGEQVLVFRNTGEVNLFFSEQLDSIVYSRLDTSNIKHEDIVSQIFYSPDTAIIIPINEIDSVAFGSRNETVFKKEVRQLNDVDCQWIIRYDGTNIFYKLSTPSNILPSKGYRLFYGERNKIFPNGLAVKVNNVTRTDDAYAINVTEVEFKEIFDRLFFAGSVDTPNYATTQNTSRRKSPIDINNIYFSKDFNVEFNGNSAKFGVNYNLNIKNSSIVARPLDGYYSFKADLHHSLGTSMSVDISKSKFYKYWDGLKIPLGRYAMVFTPYFYLKPFVSINAEMLCNMDAERNMVTHINYSSKKGSKPAFTMTTEKADGNDNASTEIICNGELYFGVAPIFDFNVLQETAGVRAKMRFGPCFNSEFGLGVITQLTKGYTIEAYGKANLSACLRLKGEATYYTRNWFTNEEHERNIFDWQKDYFKKKYDLLPLFLYSKAVRPKTLKKDIVEVAVKIKPDSLMEIPKEIGFEIADKSNISVDSCYVNPIDSKDQEKLCYATEMDITSKNIISKEVDIRPIVHYAGYTLKADNIAFNNDMPIQPMVFTMSNGITMALSGIPYSGEASDDSILYKAGPHIPTPIYDKDFGNKQFVQTFFIGNNENNWLLGTWKGIIDEQQATYTFRDDNSGTLNANYVSHEFTYYTNYPQSGKHTLYLDNDTAQIFIVNSITETTLKCMDAETNETITLTKQ